MGKMGQKRECGGTAAIRKNIRDFREAYLRCFALNHRRLFVHAEHFLHHLDDFAQRCIRMNTFH